MISITAPLRGRLRTDVAKPVILVMKRYNSINDPGDLIPEVIRDRDIPLARSFSFAPLPDLPIAPPFRDSTNATYR